MMFKTQTDDFGRITTGINKDLKSSFKGMLNGDFFKKQSLFSDSDINAIKAYNAEINRCVTSQTAFYRTMQDASVEAQNVVAAANGNTVALNNMTKASKASELGMKALAMAGNMLLMWGVSEILSLIIDGAESLTNSTKKLEEEYDKLSEKVSKNNSRLENITSTLEDNKSKIKEILDLDNPTYVDEQELAKLKEENKYLTMRKELLEDENTATNKKQIKNLQQQFDDSFYSNNADIDKATNFKDHWWQNLLTLGIYNVYQSGKKGSKDTKSDIYDKNLAQLQELEKLQAKMAQGIITPDENGKISYYDENGLKIEYDINNLDKVKKSTLKSLEPVIEYLNDQLSKIAEVDPNYESSTAQEILGKLNNIYRYTNTDDWTANIIDSFSSDKKYKDSMTSVRKQIQDGFILDDDDLIESANEDVSNMIQAIAREMYGQADDESLKKAASYLIRSVRGDLGETEVSSEIKSFLDVFNSSDFEETRDKLIELTSSGELTAKTLTSSEDYKKLLDETGLSADYCTKRIYNLVTAQDKLAGTVNTLDDLSSLYTQAATDGHVDISDISKLDDTWKNLNSFDEFTNVVGDGTHSLEEMQQAFGNLVSEYLTNTDALGQLTEANKKLYIEQLKNHGISNAQEIVNKRLQNSLVAEQHLLEGLTRANKDEYIAKLNSLNISNAEKLVTEKLQAQQEAEDIITKKLNMTKEQFANRSYEAQTSLLAEANASIACRLEVVRLQASEINLNKNGFDASGKINQLKDLATSYGLAGTEAEKLAEQQRKDEEYRARTNASTGFHLTEYDYQKAREDTLRRIDAEFANYVNNSSFKYDGGDDAKDKINKDNKSTSNSKQAYDWIEVKLKKIAEVTEKLGTAFEKTFTITSTNSKFTEYLNQISDEISANYTAISAYQSKLNSIGLSSDWIQKIQNGQYSIDEIVDNDTLKEQVSDYQTYWDKLKSCYDTIDDLEEKRLTAENNYAQKMIEYYDKEIEKTEKLISRREKLASIKETWGSSASSRDLKYQLNMTAQQIDQTQRETDELTRLQQTVSYGTDAWNTYQDKIVSNNESVVELTSSYANLAEQLANLPIDKAEKAIDKLTKKLDLITGRYDITDGFKALNKLMDKQTSNSKKQLNAYTKAYKSSTTNLQTAWSNAQIAANSPANRGKKYGEELSTAGLQVNSVAYRAVVQYNTALSKMKDALYNAQKAELDYTKTVRENTKAKYDNISAYYASTLSLKESNTSKAQAKVDYKSDAGYTLTRDDYKTILSSKKNELAVSTAERKQYSLRKIENDYKKGKLSREDYLSQLEYITSLDSKIVQLRSDIVSTAQEMANLASTLADKKIEKLDSQDELYDLKSSNAIGYLNKNSFVSKEIANINKRQQIYNDAYKQNAKGVASYGKKISSTKLTKDNKNVLSKLKTYVKGGKKIPVSLMDKVFALGDRTLYANCETYNQFLESTKTSKEVADKYKEQAKQDRAEKANQKLENIQNYYSNKQSVYSQRQQQLNNRMDIITAKGYNVSSKFYDSLIAEESKNNKSLKEERDKLTSSLANSLRNGSIKKYSDEWYEATQKIDDTTNAIDESTKSLIEFENAQRQLKWDNNDFLQERFSNLTSEIDFAIKELGREDLSDDDIGGLTDRGRASASLNLANYLIAQKQAVEYEKEIKKLQKDLEKDPYNKNIIERLDEVRKSYEDITSAMQDNKYAIIDLYSQGYDALLNKIKDLISKFTDMLDTEKDAFDYQNNISDKVKEISDLEKQISVYKNVATTEENRANIQKLNKSLADAKKDLQQTQYDKYISDTKDMLSDLEENMSDSIQDIIKWLSSDEGFKGLIEEIKNNNDTNKYIKDFLKGISYNPSDELNDVLDGKDITISTKETVTGIKDWMSKMLEYTERIANTNTDTAADSVNDKIINDGKTALGNDVKDVSDQYKAKKDERANVSNELSKSRITYEAAKKLFGKDSDVTKLAKKQYSDSKVKYGVLNQETNELKKKFKAMEYLNKNLDVTEESRSKLNDVNKKFYDAYGQRVLDDKELKELAKILGVKSDEGKSSGGLYKMLKSIGINGFAVGSRDIPYDQLALLAEEGAELHFDKSNGVLRQVGAGDMVFTSEMAKNLWDMAQNSSIKFNEVPLPNLSNIQRPMASNTIVEVGDIVMNGVNDVETFGRQLREEICKNGKTTNCLTEAVSAKQLGKGIGKAKLYR